MRTNGKDGVIKAAATGGTPAALGEVKSFTIDESNETVDVTTLGNASRRRDPGLNDWSVQVEAHYDPEDTAQTDLIPGNKIDLELYPQNETTGMVKRSGTGIVASCSSGIEVEGKVSFSVSIEADGDLARDTTT